ncbi:hypothetical protein [Hyphomonas sp.]|uniref:hypothetical protein n=1 Tax=Hyphomonas sp. TaxID=87 RepID=UPI0032EBC979
MQSHSETLLSNRSATTAQVVGREQTEYRGYSIELRETINSAEITITNDGWGFSLFDKRGDFLTSASHFPNRNAALDHCQKTVDCIISREPIPSRLPVSLKAMHDYISCVLAEDETTFLKHYEKLTKHNNVKARLKARQLYIAARRILETVSKAPDTEIDAELWRKLAKISNDNDSIPRSDETLRKYFRGFDSIEDILELIPDCVDAKSDTDVLIVEGIDLIVEAIQYVNGRIILDELHPGVVELSVELVVEQFEEFADLTGSEWDIIDPVLSQWFARYSALKVDRVHLAKLVAARLKQVPPT